MWTLKTFKTFKAMNAWCEKNDYRYWIVPIVVNNGYAVEYKPLRIIG